MTTYSDRPAVRRRIVEVLAAAPGLEAVQVTYSYPQAATRNEAIWTGGVEGTQDQVDFGTPRPGRDDEWQLGLAVAVSGRADEQAADARCQELIAAVCEALFAGDRLGTAWKNVALRPGKLDGPNGGRNAPHEPAFSVAEFAITIHVPLRGA
jgi:hypothetical protein